MKNLKLAFAIGMIGATCSFTSCKKDEVDTQLQPYEVGSKLQPYEVSLSAASWGLNQGLYYSDVSAPDLTANIANYGLVQVFMESPTNPGAWLNLPYLEPLGNNILGIFNFNHAVGTIRLQHYKSDFSTPTRPSARKFKILMIDSQTKMANPDTDWNSYEAIKLSGLALEKEVSL